MSKGLIFICVVAALTLPLGAQTQPTKNIEPYPPHATDVKGVPVPVPQKIFETLDQFSNSNWRAVQRPELAQRHPHGDQAEAALLLGVVIAEGFIAAEAQDANEVESVGRGVLKLARGLGVEKTALRRSGSIVEHARQNDWAGVRKEWDGLLPDVRQGMNQLRSEQTAQYVSFGGWLRGTEAISALILQNYSGQRAEVLREPALLDHFEKQFAAMTGEARTNRTNVKAREGLRRIRTLIDPKRVPISQEDVQGISAASKEILEDLIR